MRAKAIFILLVSMVFVASCRTTEVARPVTATREVRDDLGRTVIVPEKIDRVISLAPSLTEMIFAAGAGNKLVGVTTFCNYPAEAESIEKIGDTQTPNVEKIIALKPQIVFVSTDSQLQAFMQTLDQQSIAVYVMNIRNLDDVYRNLNQLGETFGTEKAVETIVGEMVSRESRVRLIAGHRDLDHVRRRVFVQISNEPLFTIGKDSFLTDLVKLAGGASVTSDVATAYPKLSKETAAALNPDVIFLSDSDDNREPNAAFKDSKAVKDGRVYRINADIISRPGPRLVDALEEIALKLKEKK